MAGAVGNGSGGVFAMPVEDVYAIAGHGTVLAGVIAQGSIIVGDIVQVLGGSAPLRLAVDAIESDRTLVDVAHMGSRVGLLFRGTDPADFGPGMLITSEASALVEQTPGPVSDVRRGVVKWYHPYDGVGFVVPDDGEDDVFFSEGNLERASIISILPGQRVRFTSVEGTHGPMALDLHEESDPPDSAARADEWSAGTVKWFNHAEGFGFITPDLGDSDVFVHASSLEAEHLPTLVEGQRVEFRIFWGPQGPMAESVRAADTMPASARPSDTSWRMPESAAPEAWGSPASAGHASSGSRYEGRDCALTITEDSLLIVYKSMRAQYIPISLNRLSGCHFELATRWTSGILTIATDGRPIQVPTGTSVGGDPNTIVFKAKSNDVFVGVHTWLRQVIASNGY